MILKYLKLSMNYLQRLSKIKIPCGESFSVVSLGKKKKRVNKLRKRRPWGRLFDVKMNEENGRIIPLKALLFKEIWYIMLF